MAASPSAVVIHSYQVGFGDCFLLSFEYDAGEAKHVLIDFGSTGLPKGVTQSRMMEIALDIKKRTGKLAAVVATHRHKDHISGFATAKNGKGTGDVIASLKPDLVIQPWTEDPALEREATGPKARVTQAGKQVSALIAMHDLASLSLDEVKRSRALPKELRRQLSFLGEDNIKNKSAVVNLMKMAKNNYVYTGKSAGLGKILPGVKVHVLGPPTVRQTETIKQQRHKDPDEFWHLQARAMMADGGAGSGKPLFPRHVCSRGSNFPVEARWLIYHARKLRGEQLLQIVRMLDDAMNNTSVILVFEVGKTTLLFPGDAQIENWQYALDQKKKYGDLLKGIRLYKVGHHGSLNATPKSLWKLFRHRTKSANATKRLISLMSTMEGKHGSEENDTEVPRSKLVSALAGETDHFSTQQLKGKALSHETRLKF